MNSFRIATMYESRLGRNDGNPLYVTAALKRLQHYGNIISGKGIDVNLAQWFVNGEDDLYAKHLAEKLWDLHKVHIEVDHLAPLDNIDLFGQYDCFFDIDWGEDGLGGILPYTPSALRKPLLTWVSDTHLGYDYRLGKAKQADYVFCAQKRAVDEFKRDGIKDPIWLPHAFEPLAYPKFNLLTKKYDVCFVGHVNSENRLEALDRLFKEFPNFYYGQKRFEEASRKFAESKIVFNIAMLGDTNMRCFEVLGSGSFLLTDRIPNIEELFEDGKHCVFYENLDDMIEKAKYYLKHDSEREKIAEAGYRHAMENHTMGHRVEKMLDIILSQKDVYASC